MVYNILNLKFSDKMILSKATYFTFISSLGGAFTVAYFTKSYWENKSKPGETVPSVPLRNTRVMA